MLTHFIDLEGIDQSGKKTQTQMLVARLRRSGFRVTTLSFPVYTTPSGRQIRAFLNGERAYPPKAVHMLYSLNRWENKDAITRRLEESDFLVVDRYFPSNLAYGLARGLDLSWLTTLDRGLPESDTVIVLDVPVRASFSRKARGRDLHESDRALLLRVRRAYLRLAQKYHWQVVDGARPAEEVAEAVWKAVSHSALGTRRRPSG